jgi:hypothetical protein
MKSRIALLATAALFFGGDIARSDNPRSGPPPLAVADLQCLNGLPLPFGATVMLAPLGPGILGGTQITAVGAQFNSVVLQPGLYRVSWSWVGSGWLGLNSGGNGSGGNFLQPELNGDQQVWQSNPIAPVFPFIEGLIKVTAANSVLQFVVQQSGGGGAVTSGSCQLIVQQLPLPI